VTEETAWVRGGGKRHSYNYNAGSDQALNISAAAATATATPAAAATTTSKQASNMPTFFHSYNDLDFDLQF